MVDFINSKMQNFSQFYRTPQLARSRNEYSRYGGLNSPIPQCIVPFLPKIKGRSSKRLPIVDFPE